MRPTAALRRRAALAAGALAVLVVAPAGSAGTGAACLGVARGADGWERVDAPPELDAVTQVAVSPLDRKRIWASDGRLVVRTTDGGCTWSTAYVLSPGVVFTQPDEPPIAQVVVTGPPGAETTWVVESSQPLALERAAQVFVATGGTNRFTPTTGLPPVGQVRLAAGPGVVAAVAVVERPLSDTGLAAGAGAEIWGTSDGSTWAKRGDLPPIAGSAGIAVSPSGAVHAWDEQGVRVSTDGGRTSQRLEVPEEGVAAVAVGRRVVVLPGAARGWARDDGDDGPLRPVAVPRGVRGAVALPGLPVVALELAKGNALLGPAGEVVDVAPAGGAATGLVGVGGDDPAVVGRTADHVLVLPLLAGGARVEAPRIPPVALEPPPARAPSRATLTPAETALVLDPGETRRVRYRAVLPPVPGPLDVVFLMDTTGSMQPAIEGLRGAIQRIVDSLAAQNVDVQIGLADFKDVDEVLSGRVYTRGQRVAPPGDGLRRALRALSAGGGGDGPEAHTIALTQMVTGSGMTPFVPAGREAGFRPGSTRVVVLVSDAPAHEEPPYPTVDEALRTLRDAAVRVVGISVGRYGLTTHEELAGGTGTYAPGGGLDCTGDGRADVPAGEPLVCVVPTSGRPSLPLAAPITALLRAVEQPGQVQATATGSAVRGATALLDTDMDLAHPVPLLFDVAYGCRAADAGRELEAAVSLSAAGRVVGRAGARVTCRAPVAAPAPPPAVAEPVDAAAPAAAAVVVAAPQAQPPGQPQLNPNAQPQAQPGAVGAAADQQQEAPQAALALQAAEEQQDAGELAMVRRPRAEQDAAAARALAAALAVAAAAGVVRLRSGPAPAAARARR